MLSIYYNWYCENILWKMRAMPKSISLTVVTAYLIQLIYLVEDSMLLISFARLL